MALSPIVNSFNAGELSPHGEGRTDLAKYYSACRLLWNMYVLAYGPAVRMPGTYYIAETKNSGVVFLVGFKHSTAQSYILEFGNLYIRFYKDGGQIQDSGSAYEIVSPYPTAELFNLHFEQSADVMYITHINHTYAPYKLSRSGDTSWTLEVVDFQYGPFLKENDTDITITPPAAPSDITSGQTYDSSSEDGTYTDDLAFDDDVTSPLNGWETTGATNEWISCQWGAGKTIKRIRIQPCRKIGASERTPRHCKLQGSATGAWGGEEVDIPANKWEGICSQYNTDEFEIEECNNFTDWADIEFTNSTAYAYYRVLIADCWGGSVIHIKEIEMFEAAGGSFLASSDIFTADHVGSIWQLIHNMSSEFVEGTFDMTNPANDEYSDLIQVNGTANFTTHGTWKGKVQLQRSYDGGSIWHPYHTYTHAFDTENNFIANVNEEIEDVLYRVRKIYDATNTGSCIYCLSVDDSNVKGIIKITGYVNATEVKAEIIKDLADGAWEVPTKLWSEGAWSAERGYPGTVAIFEERTTWGGATYKPFTLWFSKSHDWENMRAGTLADSALIYDLPTSEPIRWIISHETLLIGTEGDEWRLGSPDPNAPLTPSEPSAPRRQTTYGSNTMQARLVNNMAIFVQRQGRKIRGCKYYFEKGEQGGYDAEDLTLLAEHITKGGIVDIAYQNQPDSIVWGITANGILVGMLLDPSENIIGCFPIGTQGEFESTAVIPSGTSEDELWVSVKRTINGSTKRYIERFKPRDWGDDQNDCFFVHSGLTFDGGAAVDITGISVGASPYKVTVTAVAHGRSNGDQVRIKNVVGMTDVNNKVYTVSDKATNTFILKDEANSIYITGEDFGAYVSGGTVQKVDNAFSGLGHLEGETVAVLADGAVHDNVVVSNGQITLTVFANKVHAGLPYTSKLMPMKPEIPTGKGSIRGDIKRIHQIIFSFHNTVGAKFGSAEGEDTIPFRKVSDIMGEAVPLFTGLKSQSFPGGYELDGDVYVEQTQPLPMTVRSIVMKLAVYDS